MSDFEHLSDLVALARRVAAEEIMPRFQQVASARKHDGSLFTEADMASQAALQRELPKIVNCPVLGEEMSIAQQKALWENHADGLWIVDPIDGTTNFVHGLPHFSVSIALFRQGRPVLGVVYVPALDECFSAAAGYGAWMNGRSLPLRIEIPKSLCEAVAAVEPKYLGGRLPARVVSVAPFSSLRNYGSSTIDWCWLAAGRTDLMLHGSQKLWDYAAGVLILLESGGQIASIHQDNYWQDHIWQRSVVAARSPELFKPWLEWVRNNR